MLTQRQVEIPGFGRYLESVESFPDSSDQIVLTPLDDVEMLSEHVEAHLSHRRIAALAAIVLFGVWLSIVR